GVEIGAQQEAGAILVGFVDARIELRVLETPGGASRLGAEAATTSLGPKATSPLRSSTAIPAGSCCCLRNSLNPARFTSAKKTGSWVLPSTVVKPVTKISSPRYSLAARSFSRMGPALEAWPLHQARSSGLSAIFWLNTSWVWPR